MSAPTSCDTCPDRGTTECEHCPYIVEHAASQGCAFWPGCTCPLCATRHQAPNQ